jgi:SAM-dependent methyltransferase
MSSNAPGRHIRSERLLCIVCLAACLALIVPSSEAKSRQDCERLYQPQSGQPGKDVVWVPTSDALVRRMLEMARTTPSDRVYDLGAGDGKIAIAAAKQFGATAVGVEYNPEMARLAQCFVEAEGVADKVRIVNGDIFATDFSSATVVTLYLLPELNLRLRPTLLKMAPGTRVVSHSFLMDEWEPDERSSEQGSAYLWIVPAQVDGAWTFRENGGKETFPVSFKQQFQKLAGTVGADRPITTAAISGAHFTVEFEEKGAPVKLSGQLKGGRIEAVVTRGGKSKNFTGTRS